MDEILQTPKLEPKILFIGIGGCGCELVSLIMEKGSKNHRYLALNFDRVYLERWKSKASSGMEFLLLDNGGKGVSPRSLSESTALVENSEKELSLIFGTPGLAFLLFGGGGATGSGGAPVIAKILKQKGFKTLVGTTTPFFLEGKKRFSSSALGLKNLTPHSHFNFIANMDIPIEKFGEKPIIWVIENLSDAFLSLADQVWRALYQTGWDSNSSKGHCLTLPWGEGIYWGVAEGEGDEPVKNALQKAIQNPFSPWEPETMVRVHILFRISENTSLREVTRAIRFISEILPKTCDVQFETTPQPDLQHFPKVSVIGFKN